MSADDLCNTLITELQNYSTLDLATLHAMTDAALLGKAAIVVALRLGAVRSTSSWYRSSSC